MNIEINLLPEELRPRPPVETGTLLIIILIVALAAGCGFLIMAKSSTASETESMRERIVEINKEVADVQNNEVAQEAEALEKSIKLGAVSFLPKEKMSELDDFLADVVLKGGQPVWDKLFEKLGGFFNKHFGPDWKQRNQFFEDFEQSMTQNKEAE